MMKWKMYVQTPEDVQILGEFEGPWVDALGQADKLANKFVQEGSLISVGVCRSDLETASFVVTRRNKVTDTHWTKSETKKQREEEKEHVDEFSCVDD